MKTLKTMLLVMIAIASFSGAKAQCNTSYSVSVWGDQIAVWGYPDSSITGLSSYYWDFGDGDTAMDFHSTHTYVNSGLYNLCFHYTGVPCSGDTCQQLYIDVCHFFPQITSSINGLTGTFGIVDPQAGSTYNWIIYTGGGNTVTSTSANPQVTFPSWGNYSAHVDVTRANGCTDTALTNFSIANPCGAHFQTQETSLGTYNFQETDSSGTFAWDLGDGTTGNQHGISHTYTASGTYIVCLTRNYGGCTSSTCDTLVVDLCNFNPQITYSQNSNTATFGVSNVQPGSTYHWVIYTGGGNSTTSSSASPQVTFPAWGMYSAHVDVTLPNGCTDTALAYISINNPCGAHFNVYQNGLGTYYFQETDSLGTFAWDLGDGDTSSQHYFQHTYSASGTYIVCLTRDYSGCASTTCDTLVVDLCAFTPTVSYTNIDDTTVQFYANAGSGQSASYIWTITGIIPNTTALQNPLIVFPNPGAFTYCLSVISAGCAKTVCDTVHVLAPPPIPCVSSFFHWNQNSTHYFVAVDHTPGRIYAWDFGDGTTSSDSTNQHVYANAGTYIVCLTVSAGNGSCSDTHCDTIYASPPPCMSYINHSDMGFGELNFSAVLDSFSQGGSYTWDFGDGNSGTGQYVSHTYLTSGTYIACVTHANSVCPGTLCDSFTVDVCHMNGINYNLSSYNATFSTYAYTGASYAWTFNDANPSTSTAANPTVAYPTYGTYQACVTVTSQTGCSANACVQVDVPNPCHTQISYNQTASTIFQFFAGPMDSINPGLFNYIWTFGDGSSAATADPVHDFGTFGMRNVCLTVTGPTCADTVCQNINVSPLPGPSHYMMGTILKGGSAACSATVFLIKDSLGFLSLVNTTSVVDSGTGTCNGSYYFWTPEGDYYVKAALEPNDIDYAGYLPTYYGDVLNWSNATAVHLTSNQYSVNVNLIAGVNPGGPGFVGGWVSQGAGLAINGHPESRSTGDPLPDIEINLLTDNDVPVASTRTDANGRYTFSNLALGTYKVYAEEINKVPFPLNVTLTANNPSQDNVNVSINSNSAVTGLNDLKDLHVEGVFPNPVADKTTVAISLKQNSKVRLSLTDVDGRLLQNKTLELNTGTNEIKLDMSEEPAGIYHLSLTNDASKKIIRIAKIK